MKLLKKLSRQYMQNNLLLLENDSLKEKLEIVQEQLNDTQDELKYVKRDKVDLIRNMKQDNELIQSLIMLLGSKHEKN